MAKKTVSKKKVSKVRIVNGRGKYIIAVFAVLMGSLGAYLEFSSRAAENAVTNAPAAPAVYLSPTSQAIATNETFTVSVKENSGTTGVNATQVTLSYPVALLDYVPTLAEVNTDNPNGISFSGSAFSTAAEAKVNTTTGAITIARGTGGGTSVTGDQLVAKLTFKAKTTGGTANLTLSTTTALVSSSSNANILPTSGSGLGNATYIIDTTGPTVSVTAPANAATIELGSTQNVTASASDAASSVTKVEFYVDGTLKSTDTTSPYAYAWATTGVTEGSHTIYAKAYDSFNNVSTSATVTVTVKDATAPSVSITSPTAGATVSGTTTIAATATDNTGGKGIAKVEFYVDGTLKGTDTTSPYSYTWDSTTATDASHSLTAKAYDAAATANSKTSAAVSVTVDNSDKVAPTAPANLRATGNTYTSVSLAWDASTDNVGVTGYRLSRNGTQVYSGTALTYADTGLSAGTSYSYSVVAYDAKGNTSSATTISAASKTQVVGDANGDDVVNIYDLSTLLTKWNTSDATCDLNKDSIVNVYDLSILLTNWTK